MRLIDADKLNNIRFMGYRDEDGNLLVPIRDVAKAIRLAPTVDAVEVVRCKDCRWWLTAGCAFRKDAIPLLPEANDFCSHGERKDEGE